MKPVFRFTSSCMSENNTRTMHKTPLLLITGLSRKHRATCITLVTPTFLADAVSITMFFPTFDRVHSTCHRGRSRRYYTCPSARTCARSGELKDRTVINNRFLPAPVCAASATASTQGEIFSSFACTRRTGWRRGRRRRKCRS